VRFCEENGLFEQRVPRFEKRVDRRHMLYKLHESATSKDTEGKDEVLTKLRTLEQICVSEVDAFLEKFEPGQPTTEFDELLKDIVETEVKFYKWVSGSGH